MERKLMAAALSLTLSLVLLASASFAWFTISTNPEISGMQVTLFTDQALLISKDDDDEDPYDQRLNLNEEFADYVGLKPISTLDGINWFIPTYTDDGDLNPIEDFLLATPSVNMNVLGVTADGDPLSSGALQTAVNNSYYVSTTFYLKTEEEGGVNVRLSVPDLTNEYIEDWEYDLSAYGSYALCNYTINDDTVNVATLNQQAQTVLRVGFMVDDVFTIYEPNADQRSSIYKPTGTVGGTDDNQNGYILDYTFDEATYLDDYYIPTQPIAFDEDGETKILADINPNRLTVQTTSEWNLEKLQDAISEGTAIAGWSNYVSTMGRFVEDTNDLYTDGAPVYQDISGVEALASTNVVIVNLEEEVPKKITMYVWLEGQDVDCWNDIASGSVALNLELAAEVLQPIIEDETTAA